MSTRRWIGILMAVVALPSVEASATETASSYAVVVTDATYARPGWKQVVDTLLDRHQGTRIAYEENLADVLLPLAKQFPRYVCFVATPAEATRDYVAEVHRLTRQLDEDPYTDVLWGILTGYDADNALRIARHQDPLTVRRVAAGTEVDLAMCEEGVWYCELNQGHMVRKRPGQEPVVEEGPADTTQSLADTLTSYEADLFVTSGHATERDWQIGFRYRNGSFRSRAGQLVGVDTKQTTLPIQSTHPRIYMAVGNCLMGHIDGLDAMALAFMNSAGVHQMLGYTVLTWFGYAGWGCLDYYVEQPGRFTFAEAFVANHLALLHRLETRFPELARENPSPGARAAAGEGGGLLHDRDVLAFYGDPAWEARMAAGPCAWTQDLTEKDGLFTFTVRPLRGADSFKPINTNGSQRGYRPIVQFFPHRIRNVRVIAGDDLNPVITDNFLLLPLPAPDDGTKPIVLTFQADRIE